MKPVIAKHHLDAQEAHPDQLKVIPGASEGSATFVIQPGDGTRYVALISRLSDAEANALGCSEGSRLVSIMRGNNQYQTAALSGVPYGHYLGEKFGLRDYEMRAWERLLGFILGEEQLELPWRE